MRATSYKGAASATGYVSSSRPFTAQSASDELANVKVGTECSVNESFNDSSIINRRDIQLRLEEVDEDEEEAKMRTPLRQKKSPHSYRSKNTDGAVIVTDRGVEIPILDLEGAGL